MFTKNIQIIALAAALGAPLAVHAQNNAEWRCEVERRVGMQSAPCAQMDAWNNWAAGVRPIQPNQYSNAQTVQQPVPPALTNEQRAEQAELAKADAIEKEQRKVAGIMKRYRNKVDIVGTNGLETITLTTEPCQTGGVTAFNVLRVQARTGEIQTFTQWGCAVRAKDGSEVTATWISEVTGFSTENYKQAEYSFKKVK